jgi:hypothetical protein
MNFDYIILAAGLIAPVCIVSFIRKAIISVPLGAMVLVASGAYAFYPDSGIPFVFLTGSLLSFVYVWIFYGCRRAYRRWLRPPGAPSNPKPASGWKWPLLCACAGNLALLVLSFVQSSRGDDYFAVSVFPISAISIEFAFAGSSLLLFVASPLLFGRCGTLAFASWITGLITLFCAMSLLRWHVAPWQS